MSGEAWELPGYRIGRVLGRGGFATVYEAEQLSLRRTVAVKVLTVDLAAEADRRRFDRERHVLARLSEHPHVVDVHDAGVSSGRPYIVMRLYGRGTLAQLLRATGPLSPTAAVSTATKLASALDAAHTMHIVHRDVKPENVLLTDSGEPVLTDFGIAAIVDPDSRSTQGNHSTSFFTMAHVAPEVLERGHYSPASDVYALASTVYTLLAGRHAFDPSNPRVTSLILDSPVPPLGRPDVPPAMEAVLQHGLAKDPADRYPTAGAFAAALAAAAPPVSPTFTQPAPAPSEYATQALAAPSRTQADHRYDAPTAPAQAAHAAPFAVPGPGPYPPAPALSPGRRAGRRPLALVAAGVAAVLALGGASWALGWPFGPGGCRAPGFSDSSGTAVPTPSSTVAVASPGLSPGAKILYGHLSNITAVTFSCDGAIVATASADDTARLWSVSSGRLLRTFTPGAGDVTAVRFSRDGRTLATGDGEGSVRLWDVESSTSLKVLTAPQSGTRVPGVHSVDISPDGSTVAAAFVDGRVRVWEVSSGRQRPDLRAADVDVDVRVVRFSPDGSTLATGADDGTVTLWRASDGTRVSAIGEKALGGRSRIDDLAFNGDGTQLAVANGSTRVLELATGSARQVLPVAYGNASLAFSADGRTLVTGSTGGLVTVWDVVTGTPRAQPYRDHTFAVESVALSPDGGEIVSVGDDQRIVLRPAA